MELSPFGKSALALAQRGWYVFLLSPNSKVPHKSMTNWEARATNDPIEITELWNANPECNIGLATGPSGLCVLDFDAAKSPQEKSGIEAFREAYPSRKLPGTYTVRTAGGGWHLYYRRSGDLRNTASKLAERVDTRANGGYVVAPGSKIDGGLYVAAHQGAALIDVADLPQWILKALEDRPVVRSDVKPKGDSTAYALAALRGECEALATCQEGGRNHRANQAAWNVSRFVARGELDEGEAFNALAEAAESCGLGVREANNALASGMRAGLKYYA